MLKHSFLTQERVARALPRLESLLYPERKPLEVTAWHVGGEPVPLQAAMRATYRPFAVGEAWGPLWDTTWFRFRGAIPTSWAGRKVVALVRLTSEGREGFTAEGLIYQAGSPTSALNVNRSEVEIARCANGGEPYEFYVEAAANLADCTGMPVIDTAEPLFTLAQAELAVVDQEAFGLYYDYKLILDIMLALPEGSQRRAEILYALNSLLNLADFPSPETIPAARERLATILSKRNGDTTHTLSAIGHAHIDTAWLWPLRESIRKCARTFSTALDYMDRYPDYVFACSQAQQYVWMKVFYPEIYERIKAAIARRQWEPVGGMWVETDCNLASGESLIRQITYGKRFFRDEFGVDSTNAWIPDVFGYSAALPQIFAQCGITAFVTQKISWNQFNKFPHHTFLWEGLDGTRIFTHFPPADTYNGEMDAKSLLYNVSNFKEHGRASRSLYIYGYGDGGGGPTVEMLERARRLSDFDGMPRLELESVEQFLSKAKADAHDLPVWVGELYLELHRGTYTTQAKTKRGNRKGEAGLREAEFFDILSALLCPARTENAANPPRANYDVGGLDSPDSHLHHTALDRAWKLLLLNQFHDIIPGSSINWVYRDAESDYETIQALAESVIASSLTALNALPDTSTFQNPVQVFNALNFQRREIVTTQEGIPLEVSVPPCGYVVVDSAAPETSPFPPVTAEEISGGGFLIQNGILRVRINEEGVITSLYDFQAEREVLAPNTVANLFQLHEDRPNQWDAWDIDIFYKETVCDLRGPASLALVDEHPLCVTLEIARQFNKSRIRQKLKLKSGSRRIDFDTEVEWHEKQKLLKVAFPVAIHSPQAVCGIQFGHVARPTHYNTSWDLARFESCAHKWVDLSEGDYGVALLNDCKYGYDVFGHTLRLSLLRASTAPDPEADQGTHHFTYALLPHMGDFRHGRVIEESEQLNLPLRLTPLPVQSGTSPISASFFETDRTGVFIESIKAPDDRGSGLIVRLYEAHGTRGPLHLRTTLPFSRATLTNMLEEPLKDIPIEDSTVALVIHPFEIITLRLQ